MNDISQKIKNSDELAKIVADLKFQGKKVVQCHGCFELVHPGHLAHFEAAKKEGDILIVSLTADQFVRKGPGRPIFPNDVRAKSLASLHVIDYVTIDYDFTPIELLKKIKPNVYFKGSEYEKALNDPTRNLYKEAEAVRSVGGEIKFSYETTHSATNFLKNHLELYPKPVKDFLDDFANKHDARQIIDLLKNLREMKILIIGETIIDEYNYCEGMGKIPKDNLIATKYLNKETFAGGVLACANHLAGFCDNVHLVTALGRKNNYENFVKQNIKSNITCRPFFDEEGQTIVKRRFIDPSFFIKMFEIYHFDDRHLPKQTSDDIVNYLNGMLPQYDMVIVTDYGHGFFDKNIINILIQKSKFLAINTQTNSANFGFNLITKYPRADYICIDEQEARLAAHHKGGEFTEVSKKILNNVSSRNIIITRGHRGTMAYDAQNNSYTIPIFSTKIVDRVGAGDAFLAITAPCVAKGAPMDVVAFIGNAVGALHVTVVGNKSSIEPDTLYKFIQTLFK
ncbi:adenylyltransferase/cytidyltransferase family protein [Patescibacteria group bacterium]|nr:adenylyltransferase/cytidyltransferase family protein [Patescibacteria group bacterium]